MPRAARAPGLILALAAGAGIVLDRALEPTAVAWTCCVLAAGIVWSASLWLRRLRHGAGAVLGLVAAVFGAWHGAPRMTPRQVELGQYVQDIATPMRLRGFLDSEPQRWPRRARAWGVGPIAPERYVCTFRATHLLEQRREIAVSGKARLEVLDATAAGVGDEVEITGRMVRPSPARNPGGFDFRDYLAREGIGALAICEAGDAVRVLHQGSGWRRVQAAWRRRAEQAVRARLSPGTQPLGTALLLGTRGELSEELRRDFAESGTTHILAISGANVAILAQLLWWLGRPMGRRRLQVLLTLAGVIGYAFLAESQPPVLRASLMLVLVLGGNWLWRPSATLHLLGLAALGVLAWNPQLLFDVGAQLSFLAVGALIWSIRRGSLSIVEIPDIDGSGPLKRASRWGREAVNDACRITIGVWIVTLPLIVARFHLLSLAGLLINLLLAPVVVVTLWAGYLLLICGLVAPPLAFLFAAPYDWGLHLMVWAVQRGAEIPGGHMYLAGPSNAWLWGTYAGLLGWGAAARTRWSAWFGRALLAWLVIGLALSAVPPRRGELRCTVLSVGHGLAVLLELPHGRSLLYDVGQLQDGHRAHQIVQAALWARGVPRLDAVILSHADVDHFNGLPDLLQTVSVGAVLLPPSFLNVARPSVRAACEAAAREGVPIRCVWRGDRLACDPDVLLEVWHPGGNAHAARDNENSLALSIVYAGRRILLTGDLEGQGLNAMLGRDRLPVDVLLSPHHGSLAANSKSLANWAQPRWVIASAGRATLLPQLQRIYGPEARVLSTARHGAVTVCINEAGDVRVHTVLGEGSPALSAVRAHVVGHTSP